MKKSCDLGRKDIIDFPSAALERAHMGVQEEIVI